ncbi:HNH endonuclease [Kocuria sp. CPCC 205300]|uniref:HNH endonuclease n=1 Tax=Kocuria sabuli TaxID=3071448 RepID=UPI0036D9D52D
MSDFRVQAETKRLPCWLCGQRIDYDVVDPYDDRYMEPDHLHPVSTHPQYAEDPANLRASHRACNRHRGNQTATNMLGTQSRNWF